MSVNSHSWESTCQDWLQDGVALFFGEVGSGEWVQELRD